MRFRVVTVLAATMAGALVAAPARAQFSGPERPQAPWCAVYSFGWGDTRWDCIYPTLEACVPNIIAGTRGFCNPNPRYEAPEPRRRHRKH
jgi:hypothetical protein